MSRAVAAVVVTCNSAAVIDACLQSLEEASEIVVVDNGSADETCRVVAGHSGRVLIANRANCGFAAAANQGVKATHSPLILFLNPDAVLQTSLEPLIQALEAPATGAAAGRLTDAEDRTQVGFTVRSFPTPSALALEALLINRLWPDNPVNRRYRCLGRDHGQPQEVDQPAGAFLMVRREVLEAVGLWDEQFFPLWFEDVDLCRRIRTAGWRIWYEPACAARHQGVHSLAAISLAQRQVYWYGSLLGYADKHFSPLARLGIRAGVAGGAVLRMIGSLGRREACRSYAKVLALALGLSTGTTRQAQPHVHA